MIQLSCTICALWGIPCNPTTKHPASSACSWQNGQGHVELWIGWSFFSIEPILGNWGWSHWENIHTHMHVYNYRLYIILYIYTYIYLLKSLVITIYQLHPLSVHISLIHSERTLPGLQRAGSFWETDGVRQSRGHSGPVPGGSRGHPQRFTLVKNPGSIPPWIGMIPSGKLT